MRIYTRKGDKGRTSRLSGGSVFKSDPRILALGALDELNAALGLLLSDGGFPGEIRPRLVRIQQALFEASSALAGDDPGDRAQLLAAETEWLESEIDRMEEALQPLTQFILPGGNVAGAGLHWARSVARRAETTTVAAVGDSESFHPVLTWLNRLSDALFVMARRANQIGEVEEVIWRTRVRPQ